MSFLTRDQIERLARIRNRPVRETVRDALLLINRRAVDALMRETSKLP